MPKLAITGQLRAASFIEKMKADLSRINLAIKTDNIDVLELPAADELANALHRAYGLLVNKNKSELDQAKRLLRYYLFLIIRHQSQFYPIDSHLALASLRKEIKNITSQIGEVPRLKSFVALPKKDFLPAELERSKTKWQGMICAHPKRGESAGRGEVHFLYKDKKPSVRKHLEEEALINKLHYVEVNGKNLYLNLVDFNYYQQSLMHADHLLPSTALMARLSEMIEAMNYDPTFREEMENAPYNDSYFLSMESGEVVGSYWLYMAYHNSIQNLWFLLASDNTAGGKTAADPIEWLEDIEIGRAYLNALRLSGKKIDKTDILYRISDGTMLKDSFIQWVSETRKHEIKVCRSLSLFEEAMRQKIVEGAQQGKPLSHGRATKKRIQLAYVQATLFGDTSSESESSVPSSSDVYVSEVVERVIANAEIEELEKKKRAKISDIRHEIRQNIKRKRQVPNSFTQELTAQHLKKKSRH